MGTEETLECGCRVVINTLEGKSVTINCNRHKKERGHPMSYTEPDNLYDLALEKFGVEHEIKITVGEIGEFLTCIGRQAQGRLKPGEIIDEIADVTICMRQMANIYGTDAVNKKIKEKEERKLEHIKNGGGR